MRPQRIFVTGAAGFIGSTLVDCLLAEGREVVGFDSFDPFYDVAAKYANLDTAKCLARFSLIEGDIRDRDLVEKIFSSTHFDAVVHLAALAGVRPSLERPTQYADVNVTGTSVLLEAAAQHSVPHFVFASSSSVYGERTEGPFRESDPVERPISPYAATKRAGELVAHTFYHAFATSVTCLRFFTAYGPRQRPDLAIRHFAECILRDEALPIYGDGSSLRDFTYVGDVVEGVVRAIDRPLGFSILNLGAGRMVTVLEVIEMLERKLGRAAKRKFLPRQTGDVSRTWADISAARAALGYAPQTTLEEGIEKFVAWLLEWNAKQKAK